MDINKRLKELRESKGMTQKELASIFNISQQVLSKYENEQAIPNDIIINYVKHFNVSADYILGLTENKTTDKDLQFICEYTGLNQKTVEYFHKCTDGDELWNYGDIIDFIELFIELYGENFSFLIDLSEIREKTTCNFITICDTISLQNGEQLSEFISEEIDGLNKEDIKQMLNERQEDFEYSANGSAYAITKVLSNLLEQYRVSNTGVSVDTFNKLEQDAKKYLRWYKYGKKES